MRKWLFLIVNRNNRLAGYDYDYLTLRINQFVLSPQFFILPYRTSIHLRDFGGLIWFHSSISADWHQNQRDRRFCSN